MVTKEATRARQKPLSLPKKCEKDGYYWLSECDWPKVVVIYDGGPLFGVQKCENCGETWTWGD
jgi:hypothetical protein